MNHLLKIENCFSKQRDGIERFLGSQREKPSVLFENKLNNNQDLKNVGKKFIFVTQEKQDSYDPDGSIAKRGARFLESLKQVVPRFVLMNNKYYDDEGHVPFPSIYDGLKWIYSCEKA